MFNSENLQEKWQPVLEHPDLPGIQDNYKRKWSLLSSWKTKKKRLERTLHSCQKRNLQITLRPYQTGIRFDFIGKTCNA